HLPLSASASTSFFHRHGHPRDPHSFPTRRSSDLVTLGQVFRYWHSGIALPAKPIVVSFDDGYLSDYTVAMPTLRRHGWPGERDQDRKSTRLNSSHLGISYAVFCLKKKKK